MPGRVSSKLTMFLSGWNWLIWVKVKKELKTMGIITWSTRN